MYVRPDDNQASSKFVAEKYFEQSLRSALTPVYQWWDIYSYDTSICDIKSKFPIAGVKLSRAACKTDEKLSEK
jgi:hypothetical protein